MKHNWRSCRWLDKFVRYGPQIEYTTRDLGGGLMITFLNDTSRLSYAEWAKGVEHKYYGGFDPYEVPDIPGFTKIWNKAVDEMGIGIVCPIADS